MFLPEMRNGMIGLRYRFGRSQPRDRNQGYDCRHLRARGIGLRCRASTRPRSWRRCRPSRSAFRAAAAPRTGCASLRGISRPCGGRCRCRPRAASPRWCRRRGRRCGLSASMRCLMRWRTASAECASPPSAAAIAEVKKYFSSKMPRLVAMYLLAVTRDTVDSCMRDGVGDGLEIERPQMLDAVREERVLLAHDLGRDLEDRLGALVERAHEPGRGLQAVGEIGLVLVAPGGLGDLGVVALVDQHLRQRVGIELDDEAAVGARAHEHIRHDRLHQRACRRRGRASG